MLLWAVGITTLASLPIPGFLSPCTRLFSWTESLRCLALVDCWRKGYTALGTEEQVGACMTLHAPARRVSRLGVVGRWHDGDGTPVSWN